MSQFILAHDGYRGWRGKKCGRSQRTRKTKFLYYPKLMIFGIFDNRVVSCAPDFRRIKGGERKPQGFLLIQIRV